GLLSTIRSIGRLDGAGRALILSCILTIFLTTAAGAPVVDQSKHRGQHSKSGSAGETGSAAYYKKRINEDLLYIITSEEKDVFLKLKTDEEREQFIEQFWRRRNPDPNSSANEYKEEHYRRLQYARENFAYAGKPGWMMDRGMIYIKYGRPDSIDHHDG